MEKDKKVKCKYLRVHKKLSSPTEPGFKCVMGQSPGKANLRSGLPDKCYKKGACKHGRYIELEAIKNG